jgi:cytidylate kinase
VIIAIDGPAGAGKSTVARALAERLGFGYLDTGALYRAVALACVETGVAPDDHRSITKIAHDLDLTIEGSRLLVGGRDVTERIRVPEVTSIVSQVAALAGVRSALLVHQRRAAVNQDLVVEGRDIGTVVFPDAEIKVFLTASLNERARRRALQEGLGDDKPTIARIKDSIRRRDAADESRAESPLVRAPNAVAIDTTDMSLDEVVGQIVEIAGARSR